MTCNEKVLSKLLFQGSKRHVYFALVGLIAVIIFIFSPVRNAWGDTALTIPTARSILTNGNLTLEEFQGSPLLKHYAVQIVDGKPVNFFPWVVSIVAIPVVLINDLLYKMGIGQSSYQLIANANTWDLENYSASIAVGLAVAICAELIYQRLSGVHPRNRILWSVLGATTLALGTSAWSAASRSLSQHGPSLLLLLAALLVATHIERLKGSGRQNIALGISLGAILALAYTVRPPNVVGLLLFGVWSVFQSKKISASYLAGSSLVIAVWMTVNSLNGLGLVPSYSNTGRLFIHENFLEALAGNLISPSRGLFIFSPILLLSLYGGFNALRRRNHDKIEVIAIPVAFSMWIGISMFPHWWGGHSFGPRLMTDVIPYLVILAIPALERLDHLADRIREIGRAHV